MLPQKRKHIEYRDPDYPAGRGLLPATSTAKDSVNLRSQSDSLQQICNVITREFNREIALKQTQLELIDERLGEARNLIDQLRYSIVSKYYKKQEVPITQGDAAAIRGNHTLFEEEPLGPEMALHPSLKKIIGNKLQSLNEIMRSCPERAAAQNAKHTIRSRSQAQKRQERHIQQIIRNQGIVIDHSKEVSNSDGSKSLTDLIKTGNNISNSGNSHLSSDKEAKPTTKMQPPSVGKALNASRLNNKTKYIIVVGNTSKYIGAEGDGEQFSNGHMFSHKWLVYVQSKEVSVPLEAIVKKVRFFLHPSYRPNDNVDICTPPFQITRRGWGEFPMRIQLFFHEHLQQKPVQLIHNLVLDKTLSGLHTLGSETLVEILLRSEVPVVDISQTSTTKKESQVDEMSSSLKSRAISFTPKEDLDDNLLEFLKKIEQSPTSLCADIEKIQPTVMVTEPLTHITNSPSKLLPNSPLKKQVESQQRNSTETANSRCDIKINSPVTNEIIKSESTISSKQASFTSTKTDAGVSTQTTATTSVVSANDSTRTFVRLKNDTSKINPTITNKDGTAVPISKMSTNIGNILPTASSPLTTLTYSLNVKSEPKKILQKKLVKFINANGEAKYLHMLVATTSAQASTVKNTNTVAVPTATTSTNNVTKGYTVTTTTPRTNPTLCPIVIKTKTNLPKIDISNSQIKTNPHAASNASNSTTSSLTVTLSNNAITKANNAPKNVFQKGGKVYIIDPLQMKLKQQQKKQVSLLKPQISLLKQNQQKQQQQQLQTTNKPQSVASDHDYIPVPATTTVAGPVFMNTSEAIRKIRTVVSAPAPNINAVVHPGIRNMRAKANNVFVHLQKQRNFFKRHFLKRNFISTRSAVEYLLRRLPLVASEKLLVSAFPFVINSTNDFHALPAFKQKACEWLRAKYISSSIRNHKELQDLNARGCDTFWSTREIAIFARLHAYTPSMKATLLRPMADTSAQHFTDLVKIELKNEHQFQYNTLTTHSRTSIWIESISAKLEQYKDAAGDSEVIDVAGDDDEGKSQEHPKFPSSQPNLKEQEQMMFLPSLQRLEHQSLLVSDICKDIGVRLVPEEIIDGVTHSTAEMVLAESLHLFVEKLLRRAIATKLHQQPMNNAVAGLSIEPRDIGKVIAQSSEFDFLTNCNLGVIKYANEHIAD